MIDDSLVRGTTAGPLVKLIRDAGATEVHLRITCPPITHPCHFGVDMGHDGDLMAARLDGRGDPRAHRRRLARFLSLDGMMRGRSATPTAASGYCNACFTGRYPLRVRRGPGEAGVRGGAGLMRVAVIGGGGREQAIAWACARHGHDVIGRAPTRSTTSTAATADLVIVGPEAALAAGVADALRRLGVAVLRADGRARPARVVEGLRPRARRPPRHPVARRSPASTPATPTARSRGGARSAGRSSSSSTGWPPARASIVPADDARDRGGDRALAAPRADRARGAAAAARSARCSRCATARPPSRCRSRRTTSASARATPARTPAAWARTPRRPVPYDADELTAHVRAAGRRPPRRRRHARTSACSTPG